MKKTYLLKFKSTRFANRTIQALNLGEALHKVATMVKRNILPTNKVLVIPYNVK